MGKHVRYAIVGTGSRSFMYSHALAGAFKEFGTLVALCDINRTRMEWVRADLEREFGLSQLAVYPPAELEVMIRKHQVDVLIVTTIDRTHHHYIVRAMDAGCGVITEKPMTIDEIKCKEILAAINRTGKSLRVTFNYRYAPRNSRVKELLMEGAIGQIKSVHFEWLLDTRHGADYFRRWHRDKRNSGGLFVHKATHHFDLVNWWLDTRPVTVYAQGGLVFYGRENAESRGCTAFYDRGTGHVNAGSDPFALDLTADPRLEGLYLNAEKEDGYHRDQNVFGDGISIEDDLSAIVRYQNGAVMSYHLTAYSPWEGYRVGFNGTKGRLELEVVENSYVSGSRSDHNRPGFAAATTLPQDDGTVKTSTSILVRPHWAKPYQAMIHDEGQAGHGGGDNRLLRDILVGTEGDPLRRAADHRAGTDSILVGIAANKSLATGLPVDIASLIDPAWSGI